jgi:predicted RNA-binding Zn-ribbon protein involved in translation (DUF1610 family)
MEGPKMERRDGSIVRCSDCYAYLVESVSVPAQGRRPCPNCGAVTRRFELARTMSSTSPGLWSMTVETGGFPEEARSVMLAARGYLVALTEPTRSISAWSIQVYDEDGILLEEVRAADPASAMERLHILGEATG